MQNFFEYGAHIKVVKRILMSGNGIALPDGMSCPTSFIGALE
ncbi:hypothetical protein SEGD1_007 [Enterobacteria phage SEGD1]|uniref:Uncharacterized protein n=1 Tax=Enterobacteria phage SEGD1 TaxID=1805456 RepID=A0A142II70_9CAUD|nr:hypothetical protein SEGD1_007 [Enterobacteria phage SEGD1]